MDCEGAVAMNDREDREQLQAEFPSLFIACPSCALDKQDCALCLNTRQVTRRGAQQYFEDWLDQEFSRSPDAVALP
jgi:hypothetical protein